MPKLIIGGGNKATCLSLEFAKIQFVFYGKAVIFMIAVYIRSDVCLMLIASRTFFYLRVAGMAHEIEIHITTTRVYIDFEFYLRLEFFRGIFEKIYTSGS